MLISFGGIYMKKDFEIIALDEVFSLARNIAKYFEKKLYIPTVVRFADGECNVFLTKEDVTFKDKAVIIIHSTSEPVNDNLIKLLFLIGQVKALGVNKVHVIVPYFGYSRQSEGENGQRYGNAKIVAKTIEAAGADSVASVEIHKKILESFFTVPFCDIGIDSVMADHIQNNFSDITNICLVAPDSGAQERVATIASMLHIPAVFFSKKRYGIDQVEIIGMHGECDQRIAIIIDDIISTGGTAMKVADILLGNGALQLYGYFIHPVLAGKAAQFIEASTFEKIYVSNSIYLSPQEQVTKIEVFDISVALLKYVQGLID